MTAVKEQERTLDLLARIQEIQDVAASLHELDPRRAKLNQVIQDEISEIVPMRAAVAARVLKVSEPTVRSWVKAGVLTEKTNRPRLLLDPVRVLEVRNLVHDLRNAGKYRDLLDEVYHRLVDEQDVRSSDLIESLGQMRQGRGRRVRSA